MTNETLADKMAKLTEENEHSIDEILEGIKKAAKDGLFCTSFDFSSGLLYRSWAVQYRLRALGFRCKMLSGNLYVSWFPVEGIEDV